MLRFCFCVFMCVGGRSNEIIAMRSEIIVPPVTTNQKTAAIFIFHSHVMYARIVSHSPSFHARTVTSHHVDTLQSHIGRGFGTTLTPTVSSISVACSNSSHPFQNTIDLNWAVPWYLVHLLACTCWYIHQASSQAPSTLNIEHGTCTFLSGRKVF